ncbi:MAG TPA: hypothetical protein VJU80_04540 [Solirubrobacteraceae bacterium]|nr:hypothetical protein [Solirubrobacteraceae bacterium]
MDVRVRRGAVAMAIVTAGALATGGPASASRRECVSASHGHRVVAEDARGLVYRSGGRLVGCSYAGGRLTVLPGQGPETFTINARTMKGSAKIEHPTMSGRFVAYGSHWLPNHPSGGAFGPPQTERVYSFDLRAGAVKYVTTPNDTHLTSLNAIVVKPNGSVAWMYRTLCGAGLQPEPDNCTIVVKMDRSTGGREHGLDSDGFGEHGERTYTIEPGSLGLSFHRRRIYWTARKAGDPKVHHLSAPLD